VSAQLGLPAALAGSATGAAVVLADEPAPPPRVPAVATKASPTPGARPLRTSDVRQVLERPDPAGGRPWAVRRFTGVAPGARKTIDCVELGRLNDGRFGWSDAEGTFRPTQPGHYASPNLCAHANGLAKLGSQLMRFTTFTITPGGAPQPLATVSWGIVAAGVQRVRPDGEAPLEVGDGLALRIEPGQPRTPMFTGLLERADGRHTRFNRMPRPPFRGERPVAGTETVGAIAPDPAGGVPWGVIVSKGDRGGTCVGNPERIVGTQPAFIDAALDVLYASPFHGFANCRPAKPTRAYPMRISTLISSVGDDDPRGRVERRVQPARIVFSGRVHKDVVSVTITTPRDVRTLVPSGPAHVILAVYDGRFPGGKVTATARLKDGREVTRTLYSE
jgi:hypothetical protein